MAEENSLNGGKTAEKSVSVEENGVEQSNNMPKPNNSEEYRNDSYSGSPRSQKKIFVGALTPETTEQNLIDYFSKFGEVVSCAVKVYRDTGYSRGFGFIVFKSDETVKKVLSIPEHIVNGKKIDPKPAKCPKDTQRKVFVGGLDPDVSTKEIEEHFSKFGKVEAVETPFDNTKMRRRSYVFVVFSSEYEAKRAASVERQEINGKTCDVRVAVPRDVSMRQRALANSVPQLNLADVQQAMLSLFYYSSLGQQPIMPQNHFAAWPQAPTAAAAVAPAGHPHHHLQQHNPHVAVTGAGPSVSTTGNPGGSARSPFRASFDQADKLFNQPTAAGAATGALTRADAPWYDSTAVRSNQGTNSAPRAQQQQHHHHQQQQPQQHQAPPPPYHLIPGPLPYPTAAAAAAAAAAAVAPQQFYYQATPGYYYHPAAAAAAAAAAAGAVPAGVSGPVGSPTDAQNGSANGGQSAAVMNEYMAAIVAANQMTPYMAPGTADLSYLYRQQQGSVNNGMASFYGGAAAADGSMFTAVSSAAAANNGHYYGNGLATAASPSPLKPRSVKATSHVNGRNGVVKDVEATGGSGNGGGSSSANATAAAEVAGNGAAGGSLEAQMANLTVAADM